jgi:EAL domain-containing protein (putative c-di-GMP-specific phosphodiesterase class I)
MTTGRVPDDAFRAGMGAPSSVVVRMVEHPNVAQILDQFAPTIREMAVPELAWKLLRFWVRSLRQKGTRISIDDTGSGYSSLAHILKLAPDLIQLDHDLVSGIDVDPVRRALAAALVSFAAETGTQIVAEGVETEDELVA